ncbi:2-hydroxyacyl-CoA dehydratase [Rhodanobacter umsongensis]
MTTVPKDAFRRFQEELAALDSKSEPPSSKTSSLTRLDHARADFLALRRRYGLTVADVIAFFPEEEGIAYLQQLIVANETRSSRTRKR